MAQRPEKTVESPPATEESTLILGLAETRDASETGHPQRRIECSPPEEKPAPAPNSLENSKPLRKPRQLETPLRKPNPAPPSLSAVEDERRERESK
jgi:hypothetical protein